MARTFPSSASEPTPGSLADVQSEADPYSVARTIVLRRLNAMARTRKDLYDDLIAREIPIEAANAVLDRFTELGLINDAQYAEMFVASRQRSRGTAKPVLRQELRRKGVPDDEIIAALEEITSEEEYERARLLVEKKLPSLARYDLATQQRRVMNLLMRRGYSGAVASSVVREVIAELPVEESM
jgi:regulatory protein